MTLKHKLITAASQAWDENGPHCSFLASANTVLPHSTAEQTGRAAGLDRHLATSCARSRRTAPERHIPGGEVRQPSIANRLDINKTVQ